MRKIYLIPVAILTTACANPIGPSRQNLRMTTELRNAYKLAYYHSGKAEEIRVAP